MNLSQRDADGQQDALLLGLARQLRDAARGADRADIETKAEDIIAILTPATTGQPGEGRQAGTAADRRGNTIIQVLDGLGL